MSAPLICQNLLYLNQQVYNEKIGIQKKDKNETINNCLVSFRYEKSINSRLSNLTISY